MAIQKFSPQAPADYLINLFDWALWLNVSGGEQITGAPTVVVQGSDQTLVVGNITVTNGTDANNISWPNAGVAFSATGGTAGSSYTVTCSITTTEGQTADRSAILPISGGL